VRIGAGADDLEGGGERAKRREPGNGEPAVEFRESS